jgi:hypothetical protein
MRVAVATVALAAIVVQSAACSSETGIQEGILEPGGAPGSSGSAPTSGGASNSGGSSGATNGGSPARAGAGHAGLKGGAASAGGHSTGGISTSSGGASAVGGSSGKSQAGASGDGGVQSSCSAGLSGQPCATGASCNHVASDGCSAVNCVCDSSGKWACATSTLSCGTCPAAQEALCGDPCDVVAQGCLCQCGGPNFTSCSCSTGKWQCLGC